MMKNKKIKKERRRIKTEKRFILMNWCAYKTRIEKNVVEGNCEKRSRTVIYF